MYFYILTPSGKPTKIVPLDIYHLLSPVALAYWIMGDGSVHPSGVVLCTDSFSVPDVIRLMNVLTIRYGLKCTIHWKKSTIGGPKSARILISSRSMATLRSIVLPHMHPSMYYKIKA